VVLETPDIREWRGRDVVSGDGRKIGTLESVYVDTGTDQPSFATISLGLPGRRRLAFVPLDGASVGPGYVRVAHSRDEVRRAPSIGVDGELPAGDEAAVFEHYRLNYAPGVGGERRLARR
jgi:PRC-barrel domain protein